MEVILPKIISIATIPAGCAFKEADRSPLNVNEIDLPSPQPGQYSNPNLFAKQIDSEVLNGSKIAIKNSPVARATHSKCKKKYFFSESILEFSMLLIDYINNLASKTQ